MPRQKLTPGWVNSIKPTETNQIYWDTEQRGFELLVLPSGEKRYVIQYRAQRRSRRLTFRPGLTLSGKEAKAKLGEVARAATLWRNGAGKRARPPIRSR